MIKDEGKDHMTTIRLFLGKIISRRGLAVLFFLVSCLNEKNPGPRGRKSQSTLNPNSAAKENVPSAKKKEANASNDNSYTSALNTLGPTSELRHFIDPLDGTYKTKISINKNYSGLLYLSGLNITALNDKLISVRFNFGREMEAVTIPATIGRATGITPQTDIQVLIMDLRDRPFQDIRLLYDLFDYNDYAAYESATSSYVYREPLQNPLNPKDPIDDSKIDFRKDRLYCRGLKLEHDSTFEESSTKVTCDTAGDVCYYAFAKIKDGGLINPSGLAVIPKGPLVDLSGSDFSTSTVSVSSEANMSVKSTSNLKKCLPDNGKLYFRDISDYKILTYVPIAANLASLNSEVLSVGTGAEKIDYTYLGPYRSISINSWVIKPAAAFDAATSTFPIGLFPYNGTLDPTNVSISKRVERGINSYLFPRGGKMSLNSGIQYIGSTSSSSYFLEPSENREIQTQLTSGKTHWMDGCNIRVTNYDSFTGEGIGSCNVTATIELITLDPDTKKETILTSSYEIKLQLLRPSEIDFSGREVLYQSMKTCSSSTSCGPDECCFNERCWSKELVSQCIEDATTEGNLKIGETCSSDYQCSSLCCNRSIGRCAVHNTQLVPPVYCSKPPGDKCVTKEWCRQDTVRDCMVINSGVTPSGSTTCALQCYNRLENGKCSNGTCVAPKNPAVPIFDPTNPDCSVAVDPPTSL